MPCIIGVLIAFLFVILDSRAFDADFPFGVSYPFLGKETAMLSLSFFTIGKEDFKRKDQSIYHRRSDIKKKKRALPDADHSVIIAPKQNLDVLKIYVDDIADPFSTNFGNYLLRDEVNAMTHNAESYQHIVTSLMLRGVEVEPSSSLDFITATAPISKWEEIFSTEFYEFEIEGESELFLRADEYSLPDSLHDHVATVFNTIQFPLPKTSKGVRMSNVSVNTAATGMILDGFVTPALLNQVYGITSNTGTPAGSQAVFETSTEHYSPSDLTLFQQTFGLPIEPVASDIGGHAFDGCVTQSCGESNLDLQYLMAVSQVTPTTYYWTGVNMYDWLQHVAAMVNPPKVISISWGGPESWVLVSDVEAFNTQAMKLAAMGVTLITSSGDDGAPGPVSRNGPMYCGYHAEFPSISEYVTSVGATMGPESGSPEVVCQSDNGGLITSGGGFSEYFPSPSWQSDSVDSYFSHVKESISPGYNRLGRAYPDVSLLGHAYVVAVDGGFVVESGTSASSPVFAGMIALINAKRLANGQSTLGWLNPTLYALGKSKGFIRDVTEGHNRCNVQSQVCCDQGFYAAEGWDPVSGLGSIDFPNLVEALTNLGSSTTRIPTETPVVVPEGPDPPPDTTSGWLTGTYYAGKQCDGEVVYVEGLKMGTCFLGYITGILSPVYFKYSCDPDNGYVSIYSDSLCQNVALSLSLPLTCAYSIQNAMGEVSSYQLNCSAPDTKPLSEGSYIIRSAYDYGPAVFGAPVCSSSEEVYFTAYQNAHCYNLNGAVGYQSMMLTYPQVSLFSGKGCSGAAYTFFLATACTSMSTVKNDDQDYLYSPLHLERLMQWYSYVSDGEQSAEILATPSVLSWMTYLLVGGMGALIALLMVIVPRLTRRIKFGSNPYTSIEMVELP